MTKVGITGGIGSGKTTVSRIFELKGIPVFYADNEAKVILNTNNSVRSKLIAIFGSDIYLPNRTIDRKKFASIIFNNEPLLNKVNQIIHPVVRNNFFEWCEKQSSGIVLYEAAILFESGYYQDLDFNILVLADQETRIKRIIGRDKSTREMIQKRMDKQWKDKQKLELTNYTIYNNSGDLLIPQVLEILEKIETHG